MFKSQIARFKNLDQSWWVIVVVIGAAILLFSRQISTPVFLRENVPPVPTSGVDDAGLDIATPPQAQEAAKEATFLAEYDPTEISLLDISPEGEDRSGWEMSTDLILKLALVLGLVYIAMHGLRWLQKNKNKTISGGATINVLETAGLAPGRSLHLIVVGEKTLLLGSTEHQIAVLTELANPAIAIPGEESAFEEALNQQQQVSEVTDHFNSPQIDQLLPQNNTPEPSPQERPVPPMPPVNLEDAVEYHSSWQSTLNDLRAGIRNIQETVER